MKVRNLSISFKNKVLLENINFTLEKGKTLAITGESGVGKSLLSKALVRLLDSDFNINADEFSFNGIEILKLSNDKLRELRSKIALVLQDSESSLYPCLDIGKLCSLILKTHTNLNQKEYKKYVFSYFEKLGFDNLDLLWHSYPYELSVGMARRASLALALLHKPQILICDEVTASLDAKNTQKIIEILKELKKDIGLICITHDLYFIRSLADEVLVLEKERANFYTLNAFLGIYNA
ncbi:ATP-binding cassette domain-containing protein [Campylobacter estrildidarum]|uniref:ATP-binding cassette domain-containing protein n=1 Tax=Campylobacter estrildidarum TaxID=2510189 RepID=UPI001FE49AF3|nr:ABC transporter ATP-binding protein [Campylobacter estrildidarum]